MANDFFGQPTRRKQSGGGNLSLQISSDITDLAETRKKALSSISKQVTQYVTNCNGSNTQQIRSNLDSFVKAAQLSPEDTKEMLLQALAFVATNI